MDEKLIALILFDQILMLPKTSKTAQNPNLEVGGGTSKQNDRGSQ